MIVVNQVHCHKCGDKPYSAHGHDFKYCKCGNIAVDGGMNYLRRVGDGITDRSYTDLSYSLPTAMINEMSAAVEDATAQAIAEDLLLIIQNYGHLKNESGPCELTGLNPDVLRSCVNAVQWGIDTGRNNLGIALALTRALHDNNCLIVGDE